MMDNQSDNDSSRPQLPLARIRRLDEAVVNRIAAGEIIHRPANALKELMENALDAGGDAIHIYVKEGGLKLLQIQDNGCGITKEDLDIVCERFTTSKLKSFEDLSSMTTFGFRGEALASISHVAHLTITTKTRDSNCAYKAIYSDGSLVAAKPGVSSAPKPCAGNNGTLISVEDLFYNVPTRRKAFRGASEEYNRILDVVGKYAVHNAGIALTCRKYGSNSADIHTTTTASTIDNIRQIYGQSVASELLKLNGECERPKFTINGWISNANYSVKKTNFLLFINNRLVDSLPLKKSIESIYARFLPKGSHPFVYLSLILPPENLDVNVHPTKLNVVFLHEEELILEVGILIEKALAGANSSRNFLVQSVLSAGPSGVEWTKQREKPMEIDTIAIPPDGKESDDEFEQEKRHREKEQGDFDTPVSKPTTQQRPYEHQLVRTDSRSQTLDRFYAPARSHDAASNEKGPCVEDDMSHKRQRTKRRKVVEIKLASIKQLKQTAREVSHEGLTHLFADHTFVGCVDDRLALVQHSTKLYLVDYEAVSEEYFYQTSLGDFGNFAKLKFREPLPIREMLLVALETEATDWEGLRSNEDIAEAIRENLVTKKDLLAEYFNMDVTTGGELLSLPLMMGGYIPNLDKIPLFLLRLGSEVDWNAERPCLGGICREFGILYATEQLVAESDSVHPQNSDDPITTFSTENDTPINTQSSTNSIVPPSSPDREIGTPPDPETTASKNQKPVGDSKHFWFIEHRLFPAFKTAAKKAVNSCTSTSKASDDTEARGDPRTSRDVPVSAAVLESISFHPPKKLVEDGSVIQIANLPDMYKVFERC